ncbi:MAG TPA: SGNH/GDSL hydrolase family protein [Candidatus Binataceae bacterium]|nr:SGNH/GDSL hydrolase family protein [Candidatus Binataceae bacterium]
MAYGLVRGNFRQVYTAITVIFFNFVVLLVLFNFIAWLLIHFWLQLRPDFGLPAYNPVATYGYKIIAEAYPGWSQPQISELIEETWDRLKWRYDTIAQLQLQPYQGQFVNVASAGYRQGPRTVPWPPDPGHIKVFILGGSTTFGMGLTDGETIPSQLQKLLDKTHTSRQIDVYNFGFSAYTSTQELLLYIKFLRMGIRPDIVIFIDGLNECLWYRNEWQEGDAFAAALHGAKPPSVVANLPLVKLFDGVIDIWKPKSHPQPVVIPLLKEKADTIISRYDTNRTMINDIAKCFGTKALLVWQPVPMYDYDIKYHFLYSSGVQDAHAFRMRVPLVQAVYPTLKAMSRQGTMGRNFLWLGDIQNGLQENLYVDTVHYNPTLSALISRRIYDYLVDKHWVPIASGVDVTHAAH